MGCAVVLFATYLYTKPERAVALTSRSRVSSGLRLDEEGKIGFDDTPPKSRDGRDLNA